MNPFTTYQFRKMPVRIVRKSDKNYFVIRDICNILGWSNPNRELAKHTENVPLYERIRTPGGLQVRLHARRIFARDASREARPQADDPAFRQTPWRDSPEWQTQTFRTQETEKWINGNFPKIFVRRSI